MLPGCLSISQWERRPAGPFLRIGALPVFIGIAQWNSAMTIDKSAGADILASLSVFLGGCDKGPGNVPKERTVRYLCEKGKYFLILGISLSLLFLPRLVCAAASSPMALIQSGTDKVIGILHQSQRAEAPSLRQRKGEILEIVDEYFNFEEMGKRALGRPWKDQPPDKRQEFSQLFKQLLFNTYVSRLENYTGSNERVFYDSEKLDGDYALVKSHILYQGNNNVEIDYRLHRDDGQWKVYDVVVEGISFVDNYRSQFSAILTNESFDSLLKMLRQKVQQPG
jgi:phospholipid transport system substrate-binding protein